MREPAPARVFAAPVYCAGLDEVAVPLEARELVVMTIGAGVVAFVVVVVALDLATVLLQAETVTVTVTALWAEVRPTTAAMMAAVENFIMFVVVGRWWVGLGIEWFGSWSEVDR